MNPTRIGGDVRFANVPCKRKCKHKRAWCLCSHLALLLLQAEGTAPAANTPCKDHCPSSISDVSSLADVRCVYIYATNSAARTGSDVHREGQYLEIASRQTQQSPINAEKWHFSTNTKDTRGFSGSVRGIAWDHPCSPKGLRQKFVATKKCQILEHAFLLPRASTFGALTG
jgi:hypothetical protein